MPPATGPGRTARGIRRREAGFEARASPSLRDLVCVNLRAARFGVVEVAPREKVHALEPNCRGDVAELRRLVVGVRAIFGGFALRHAELLPSGGAAKRQV